MKISTKGRYAVRLMYDLAMHHTGDWIALKGSLHPMPKISKTTWKN